LVSEQLRQLRAAKLVRGGDQFNSDKQALADDYLSRSVPLAISHIIKPIFSHCLLHFMMAAIQSIKFIPFVPPSNRSLYNRNTLRSTTTGQSIPSLTSSQKIRKPAAVLSCSGGQSAAERNAVARAEGTWKFLARNGSV
jgi:hypothetical protein